MSAVDRDSMWDREYSGSVNRAGVPYLVLKIKFQILENIKKLLCQTRHDATVRDNEAHTNVCSTSQDAEQLLDH